VRASDINGADYFAPKRRADRFSGSALSDIARIPPRLGHRAVACRQAAAVQTSFPWPALGCDSDGPRELRM